MSPFGPKLAYLLNCTRIHLQNSPIATRCRSIAGQSLETLGPKSTGCTVYYPRGGVWEIRIDRRHFGSYRSPGGSSGTGLSRKRS